MTGRYARHDAIPGWDQHRLADAAVVILGVGALGTEVARLLARSGVGLLALCDPDTVSESNLSRGALFTADSVGAAKVTAAEEALRTIGPDTRVDPRPATLSAGVGLAELRAAGLVVSCLDSRAARLQLAERCTMVGAAMLDGGTHPWGGEVRYYPAGGSCFGCGLSHRDRAVRDDPWSCGDYLRTASPGAAAASTALVASLVAVAATRLLLGMSYPAGTLRIDGTGGPANRLPPVVDPHCPMHRTIETDSITRLPLTNEATAGQLSSSLTAVDVVLCWNAFPLGTDSRDTSVQLRDADPNVRLCELGVAPGEILHVERLGGQLPPSYVELAGTTSGQEGAE